MEAVLQQILEKLDKLESGMEKLETGVANLETGQAKLEASQAKLEAGQAKLEAKIDHEITRELKLLGEGQIGMNEKFRQLDDLIEKVDDIQNTVDVLKVLTVKK